MAMTDAQIDKWQAALRSGEYKQHRGDYVHGPAMCCLHVAGVVLHNTPLFDDPTAEDVLGIDEMCLIDFINANDKKRLTFPEIADLIEFMREELRS